LLRGVASPEEIIAGANERRMPAVGLTDTTGMCAAVAFYQKALDAGIKPMPGAVLDLSCLPELIASGMHPGTKTWLCSSRSKTAASMKSCPSPRAYNRYGGLVFETPPCA